jgi:predicted enzyme related to lactoylglutathione lyase
MHGGRVFQLGELQRSFFTPGGNVPLGFSAALPASCGKTPTIAAKPHPRLLFPDGPNPLELSNFKEARFGEFATGDLMRIKLNSIFVEDQDKALAFYTEVLGFKKSKEIPMGEFKWLTVVSPDGDSDVELVFEPNANPVAKTYQEGLFKQGIPITAFEVDDIHADAKRLKKKGVRFTMDPTDAGSVKIAIFSDTCGNLIQIYEPSQKQA